MLQVREILAVLLLDGCLSLRPTVTDWNGMFQGSLRSSSIAEGLTLELEELDKLDRMLETNCFKVRISPAILLSTEMLELRNMDPQRWHGER